MPTKFLKRTTGLRVLAISALALAWFAVGLAPADASNNNDGGTYYTPPTRYHDSGEFDPECQDVNVTVKYHVKGIYSERNVKDSHGQAFLARDHYRFFDVWTNADTGETLFTDAGHFLFQEVSAKPVPKWKVPDDLVPPEGLVGPIYLFTSFEAGHGAVRDDGGDLLYRTAGLVVFKNLFDTLGDHQPGGTSLDFRTVKVVGPHPLMDIDLCDVAADEAN